jgi:hypothetical protein
VPDPSGEKAEPYYDSNYNEEAPELVTCPPHTTEAKLVRRIDLHVIPFLCIMYLLAFLDRYVM